MNELRKEKKGYLLSVGFKPMAETESNTLFVLKKVLVSISDDSMSLDDLKDKVENMLHAGRREEKMVEPKAVEEKPAEKPVEPEKAPETSATENKGDPEEKGEEPAERDPFGEGIESVEPFYLCKELKEIPTPKFMRLTIDGNRYYYTADSSGNVLLFASATNLIRDGYVEKTDALTAWKQLQKYIGRDPEAVAQYEADKGTIMHCLYGHYLTGRDIPLHNQAIINLVKESDLKISKENLERFFSSQEDLDDMKERLKRFAKFCWDYKVKPLAIEKILCCEKYKVASPIDLICTITYSVTEEGYFGEVYQKSGPGYQKGDPKKSKRTYDKEENVIIDFKSGSIFPHYALQLHLYKLMVQEWYPSLKIERIFNFSPKSDSSRKYTFREQTSNKELRKADAVFTQGMINHENKDKTYTMTHGVLNIKKEFREEDYSKTFNIPEELSKRFKPVD